MNRLFARAGHDGAALTRGDWMGKQKTAPAARPAYARNVAKLLKSRGLRVNGSAIASICEIDRTTGWRLLTGESKPTDDVRHKLAKGFGLADPDSIMEDDFKVPQQQQHTQLADLVDETANAMQAGASESVERLRRLLQTEHRALLAYFLIQAERIVQGTK